MCEDKALKAECQKLAEENKRLRAALDWLAKEECVRMDPFEDCGCCLRWAQDHVIDMLKEGGKPNAESDSA